MAEKDAVNEALASLMQATAQFSKVLKENSNKAREQMRKEASAKYTKMRDNLAQTLEGHVQAHESRCLEAVKEATAAITTAQTAVKAFDKAAAAYEEEIKDAMAEFRGSCEAALRDMRSESREEHVAVVESKLKGMTSAYTAKISNHMDTLKEQHARKVLQFIQQLKPVYDAVMEEVSAA